MFKVTAQMLALRGNLLLKWRFGWVVSMSGWSELSERSSQEQTSRLHGYR